MRLDFTPEVGQVAETVELKGGAALLETEHAALSTVVVDSVAAEHFISGGFQSATVSNSAASLSA